MFNAMRSRWASKESEPGARQWGSLGMCGCDLYRTHPATHDLLLGFERGVLGAVEVMEHLDVADVLHDGMTYPDLPDWVGDHRWQNPRAVGALARRLSDADQTRRELGDLRTAMEAAVTVLTVSERWAVGR